jgi:general secretion pathway protein G
VLLQTRMMTLQSFEPRASSSEQAGRSPLAARNSQLVAPSRRERGFTLIEVMVVITFILILLGMAMPIYTHSVQHAREEKLRRNLDTLNEAIFQYTLDKQKTPQSLQDLKSGGYIDNVPDDITGSSDTWETESGEDFIMSLDQKEKGGIIGVHSGSQQVGGDGKAYSTW